MSEREKKIAEIREALEKATPGPWVAVDEIATVYSADADAVIEYSADEREEDIRLIANAPEWLRFLLEERAKLIEGLRLATDVLGTVPMNDARLWGVYNKLCDILKEYGVTVE